MTTANRKHEILSCTQEWIEATLAEIPWDREQERELGNALRLIELELELEATERRSTRS